MHAIVSLLDKKHYRNLENLWRELEFECGLSGINLTPLPHFTWHLAAEYDFDRLGDTLPELVQSSSPFNVRTTGLGLFTGDIPVVYIPLIKDEKLAAFHRSVWKRANPTAIGASAFYAPDAWVPHISVAHGDVNRNKLSCAVQRLAFQTFNWEIEVDHLALVYQYSGQVGEIQAKFPFSG